MKIVIAYEGADPGDAALDDLARAGLPTEGQATVFTVADIWPVSEESPSADVLRAMPYVAQTRARAKKIIAQATLVANRGAARVRALLPGWRVTPEAAADSPAWAIFKKARDSGADLVIVGCRPASRIARWAIGSVSSKVVAECAASVRVARSRVKRADDPLRLIIGLDGSKHSDKALAQVLERVWPQGTFVRVVAAVDDRLRHAPLVNPALARFGNPSDKDPRAWVGRLVESAERRLLQMGLAASGRVIDGDPRTVLADQAARWRADALFVGARGVSRWERALLGSVSTALAARAPCTVEIVR
ncbi:MAG: universal stress protein [Elusimicrobia bacterium]|nr:universal stress protein [Elusimicrobiota bacterium]MBP9127587.1 universal stress protein [Elusimicrobiota bacterium]MBP9698756.1 universal stress protein [Elusimicrobiota bacterium]